MKLNDSQKNLIQHRLHSVWQGERNCPVCSNPTTWHIGGIVEVREFNEGNLCHGAAITPLAKGTCSRCGYVVLFNAIILGVVDSDTAKVKESP